MKIASRFNILKNKKHATVKYKFKRIQNRGRGGGSEGG